MKTHKLIIENNKTKINEVEVSIDQIANSTGIGETVSTINQLIKVLAANVKLVIGVVLSFRSLSAKKIVENINAENKKIGARVRFAMRKIDRNIDELSRDSKIGQVFAATMPFSALTNYIRTEVDNAGGLSYYLDDFSQNILVGDIAKDLYALCEGVINKSLDRKPGTVKDEKDREKELAKFINEVLEEFRKEFGERAYQLFKDYQTGKETPDVEALKNTLVRIKDVEGPAKEEEIYNFFKSLGDEGDSESVDESFNKKIKLSTLILNENKIDKGEEGYIDLLIAIISILNLDKLFIKTVFDEKEIVENNINQDIKEFSVIYQSLICDNIVFKLLNNYINKSKLEVDQVISDLNKNMPKALSPECRNETNKHFSDIKSKFNLSKDLEIIQCFLSILKKIEENIFYKDKQFINYSKNLKESSNSKSSELKDFKNKINNIYKENIAFRIKDAEQSLAKKAEEINEN